MIARVLALIAKVPGIAWVALLVVASLAAAGYALYRHGVVAGEVHVHRIVLQDSTCTAVAIANTAHQHSETVVAVAAKARGVSDATRAKREAVRTAALAELLDPGLPHVHELVALDDSLSRRDSVTIAVQAGAIDTLQAEIAARERLDSLRVETIQIGQPEPDHHSVTTVVAGAVAGALAMLALLHFAR